MPQISIPDALFRELQNALPKAVSPNEFVEMAVREKLIFEDQKRDFYRLSDRARAAMSAKTLTESDILAEFEATRHELNG